MLNSFVIPFVHTFAFAESISPLDVIHIIEFVGRKNDIIIDTIGECPRFEKDTENPLEIIVI